MKTGLNFLKAAKRCEMADLQQLAHTCALAQTAAKLIHELQRERGLSNLHLASASDTHRAPWQQQTEVCLGAEEHLRHSFHQLEEDATRPGHSARLFNRIAYALQGLDALPLLRLRVLTREWTVDRAVAAYIRVIAALLAVVYEAADTATNPDISRLLVALFNFMQGKEYAGQERATGAAMYAAGTTQTARQQRLLHLIDSQDRCLEVFASFAPASVLAHWQTGQQTATLAELERMRRVLCTATHAHPLDTANSAVWFDCCSRRMQEMKDVEDALVNKLLTTCQQQLELAKKELTTLATLQTDLEAGNTKIPSDAPFFDDSTTENASGIPPASLNTPFERSILDLVHEQALRLQSMHEELDKVRASLNERKLIERAKGLLMAHRHLSEADAHKTMRQMAMSQNRRLVDVADAVLAMAEVLPITPPH